MNAICFRCDWEGAADGEGCPRCGAPLYRTATPELQAPGPQEALHDVTASVRREPGPEVPSPERLAASPEPTEQPDGVVVDGDGGPAPSRRGPARRPLRIVGVISAVAVVAALVSAQHRSHRPSPASGTTEMGGTLVYASAGRDGLTGRLWRVSLGSGRAIPGPRTVLPDQIVPAGPGERWVGVSAGRAAYVFRDLTADGAPQLLAEGDLVAWVPGGNAVFVVTRESSAGGECPLLRISFVNSISHGQADFYEAPMCSTADGLGVDGLTRPFISLEGPDHAGVYELGYKRLHLVVPRYSLLSVSPLGDMLVGPRIAAPAGGTPWPAARTLLVWQGIGGPSVIGDAHGDFVAERFLAWSKDGRRAALLGTLGGVRSVWLVRTEVGTGRERPVRVAPALPSQIRSVGAAFAGNTVLAAAAGHVYASGGRGYRELELPGGAPPPSGPLLWLDR
jgi:hypothetical protein